MNSDVLLLEFLVSCAKQLYERQKRILDNIFLIKRACCIKTPEMAHSLKILLKLRELFAKLDGSSIKRLKYRSV